MKNTSLILAISAALTAAPAQADIIPFLSGPGKIDTNIWYISSGWVNGPIQSCEWRLEAIKVRLGRIVITLADNLNSKLKPVGCGEIHTKALYGYGRYTARLRSAAGSGLNTAFFTYVGPGVGQPVHDEIDFEFLGKNPQTVQLNYWTNGKSMDGKYINLGFDASKAFHEYSFVWQPGKITWYVDSRKVHETPAGAAVPSHPGRIYMTLWSGSSSVNDWLGAFNYTGPVTAEFERVSYTAMP